MAPNMFFTNNSQCSLWPGKDSRCQVVYVLSKLAAAVSITGCFFVMLTILILKKYKFFVQEMIFSLALAACLESIGYISNDDIQDLTDTCRFLGFFAHYFGWATMLWVFVITINMLLTIKQYSSRKYLKWFHTFVWTVSLIITLIPFAGDSYGPAGVWCWIRKGHSGMRFGTWYIPLFVIGISMLFIYLYIIYYVLQDTRPVGVLRSPEEEQENIRYREELKPLLTYPLIYILFTIPGLMYRIDDAVHPNEPPNYALVILSVIFLQSIGFGNSLSFIIFNTASKEISWPILKQQLISLFSPNPHIIHDNYGVEDIPVSHDGEGGPEPSNVPPEVAVPQESPSEDVPPEVVVPQESPSNVPSEIEVPQESMGVVNTNSGRITVYS